MATKHTPPASENFAGFGPEGLILLALEAIKLEERERAAHMARVFGADERLIKALLRGRI